MSQNHKNTALPPPPRSSCYSTQEVHAESGQHLLSSLLPAASSRWFGWASSPPTSAPSWLSSLNYRGWKVKRYISQRFHTWPGFHLRRRGDSSDHCEVSAKLRETRSSGRRRGWERVAVDGELSKGCSTSSCCPACHVAGHCRSGPQLSPCVLGSVGSGCAEDLLSSPGPFF